MSAVLIEILVLLLLAIGNGIFAMSEIAVVSARRARLQERVNKGETRAETALALAEEPNRFLSTIQVGITLIGIFMGAFGGVTLARYIEEVLLIVPVLAPYSNVIGIGIVVLGTTYLTLVIGELVPKRIALTDPDAIAVRVAEPMELLSRITSPIVTFLTLSTEAVLRILPIQPSDEPPVTEEEIRLLLERGTKAGIFEQVEQDIVKRALRLDERRIDAIMTPRTQIIWLDLNDKTKINARKIVESGRSRYPVCRGDLDNVMGIVRVRDLFSQGLADDDDVDIGAAMHQPLFVVESMRALRVLELFREHRTHIALVLDEFGAIEGLVTMHDILEALVGDAPGFDEIEEPYAVRREDGSWLLDGMLPITEFYDMFDVPQPPSEERGDYHTLAGFVVTRLGRVPSSAESFNWGGVHFEVVDMDGNRVDKVLVMLPDRAEGAGESGESDE